MISSDIKVASFNLRRDFGIFKRYRWETRREVAAEVIVNSGASIIGVQELLPSMRDDLMELLPGYSIFGQGRTMGKKPNSDEHSDIIIRDSDISLSASETFWISKHPDTVSHAYYSIFPRICTVGILTIKSSGKRIRVFNTHFDHICSFARTLGVRMILDYVYRCSLIETLPTIIMGDFNASLGSQAVKMLRENRHRYSGIEFQDVCGVMGTISNTYHGNRGVLYKGKSPIDYIFVSPDFEILDVKIDDGSRDGVFPSDHFPVIARLNLRGTAYSAMETVC